MIYQRGNEIGGNEWARACNLRDAYWLYVVFDCAPPAPAAGARSVWQTARQEPRVRRLYYPAGSHQRGSRVTKKKE